ncbi:Na+-dependent transporter [uncultured Bradyrhizobium sp.]|uniref:Na+-dependent transporter n=1 Tax=uncultured Bradyrhizobium sp. TaxID=199684 RepID=UPI0035CC692B
MPGVLTDAVAVPVRALAWLGRQGTRAVAALVLIGLALPPLGELLKPYVAEAIFLLLCISFMRVDIAALRDHLRRPAIVLAASLWDMIAVPALIGLFCLAAGLDKSSPDLFLALMLQAVASPMMAAPALAAVIGLDSTLTLITLVTGTALVPLTAPLFAWLFLGGALVLSPLALGLKLAFMLAGSLAVAFVIRWMFGIAAIRRHKEPIDGINIVILLVFVSAVMGSVASSFWADPLQVLGIALLSFAIFFALVGATMLVFRRLGSERALALGLLVSQRNMGLMVAAAGGTLPDLTWLYFALSQFPIYWSPQSLKPVVGRMRAGRDEDATESMATPSPKLPRR